MLFSDAFFFAGPLRINNLKLKLSSYRHSANLSFEFLFIKTLEQLSPKSGWKTWKITKKKSMHGKSWNLKKPE